MAALAVTLKPKLRQPRKVIVELDAEQFERVAASFGLYNPDFLKSIDRAEQDFRAGRTRKVRSLKDLRS